MILMKKRIFFLIVFLSMVLHPGYLGKGASVGGGNTEANLTLISSDATRVIFELSTPGYEILPGDDDQQDFQLVTVPGLDQISEPGKPQLPVKGLMIGVPAEAEISISILEDEKELLEGEFNIQPVGQSEGLIDDFQPGPIMYLPDAAVYQNTSLYPKNVTVMGDPAWIREQRVVQAAIYPFQYNPAEKTLIYHKRIRVEVNFIGSNNLTKGSFTQSTSEAANARSPFESVYESQLINYQTAKAWRTEHASTSIQGASLAATNGGFDQTQSLGPRL